MIIDQFEEILTTNLRHWQQREGFFTQLREAIEDDDYLWVILSMREDYVGGLDPYVHILPGKLRARLYMGRGSVHQAGAVAGRLLSALGESTGLSRE